MRIAGIVMTIMGLVALVFTVLGALGDRTTGDNLPFLDNSWFMIMAIFWGGAGISVLLTFGKESNETKRR